MPSSVTGDATVPRTNPSRDPPAFEIREVSQNREIGFIQLNGKTYRVTLLQGETTKPNDDILARVSIIAQRCGLGTGSETGATITQNQFVSGRSRTRFDSSSNNPSISAPRFKESIDSEWKTYGDQGFQTLKNKTCAQLFNEIFERPSRITGGGMPRGNQQERRQSDSTDQIDALSVSGSSGPASHRGVEGAEASLPRTLEALSHNGSLNDDIPLGVGGGSRRTRSQSLTRETAQNNRTTGRQRRRSIAGIRNAIQDLSALGPGSPLFTNPEGLAVGLQVVSG